MNTNLNTVNKYPIGFVCKQLNILEHQLRYFERCIGYNIERDDYNNRTYNDSDIHNLKLLLEHKTKYGMTYRQIKKKFFRNGTFKNIILIEVQVNGSENKTNEEKVPGYDNKTIKAVLDLTERIKFIDEKLSKFESVEKEIDQLKYNNLELIDKIEKVGRKKDKELIVSIKNILDDYNKETKNKKHGFFARLFTGLLSLH